MDAECLNSIEGINPSTRSASQNTSSCRRTIAYASLEQFLLSALLALI